LPRHGFVLGFAVRMDNGVSGPKMPSGSPNFLVEMGMENPSSK